MKYGIIAVVLAAKFLMGFVTARASQETTSTNVLRQQSVELVSVRRDLASIQLLPSPPTQTQYAKQMANQSGRSRRKLWIAVVPLIAVGAVLIWAWAMTPST